MRIIHTADIHLGHRLRTGDIFAQLKKLIKIIKEEKVNALIISGDLFEKEWSAISSLRENLRELFSEIPETEIFILPGNHDELSPYRDEFYYGSNVNIIKRRPFEIRKLGDIDIYFFPFHEKGSSQEMVKVIKSNPSKAKFKIGVAHGTYMDDKEIRDHLIFQNEGYYPIFSSDIDKMNLDYLALGHFHYTRLWKVGNTWCGYPGSIEVLSFKEPVERKVIMIETNDKLSPKLMNLGMQKRIGEIVIDVDEIDRLEEVRKDYDILRVIVTGIVKNEKEIIKKLNNLKKELDIYEIKNLTKSFASIEETKLGKMIKEKIDKKIEKEPERKEYWKKVLISGFEFIEQSKIRK